MSLDYQASRVVLETGVIGELVAVAAVRIAGPDAASFLQGQVSQDLAPLVVGMSAEALLLTPQGRLEALVRVVRTGEEEFLVVTDAFLGEAAYERLRRFKIRVRAELGLESWSLLRLFSLPPGSDRAAVRAAAIASEIPDAFSFALSWTGVAAAAVLAPFGALDEEAATLSLGDPEAIEYLRISAGIPVSGRELDEKTIAAEADLVDRTVSFSKGCYTGQELVARLDARGSNVARRLRLVRIPEGTPAPGDQVREGETVLGELTSVAPDPFGGAVALGYFRRGVVPPAQIELFGATGSYTGEVLELPA